MNDNMLMNEDLIVTKEVLDGEIDFDELEKQLESGLEDSLSEWEFLKEEKSKISDPDSLGNTVLEVIWDQFIVQVGAVAGEDFIKENRGLKLDLRDEAHIQTVENFANGKIATHNYISKEQLENNYDRFKNMPHGEYRDKYVDPQMDKVLPRAGALNKQGIETVRDIYTGRQISTKTKLDNGENNPKAAQREHVTASEKIYKNESLQMSYDNEGLADVINDPDNLQGYTTADRNQRKGSLDDSEMDPRDKTKHYEEAKKKSDEFINKKEKEGENRLKSEGRKTQGEELFKVSGKALRAAVLALLAELIRNIIGKFIHWLKSKEKSIETFLSSIKEAIANFISNLKQNLLSAGVALASTVITAIFGPVANAIRRVWTLIKQGGKSVKEAIEYIKKPENRNKSFSILMLEVSKIVMTGLTAMSAVILGEVIEAELLTIPVLAVEIPLIGSLANIIGIFFGAVVAGIAGALVINIIDRIIAKKQRREITEKQIDKGNEVLKKQEILIAVKQEKVSKTKENTMNSIKERHEVAAEIVKEAVNNIFTEKKNDNSEKIKNINSLLDQI